MSSYNLVSRKVFLLQFAPTAPPSPMAAILIGLAALGLVWLLRELRWHKTLENVFPGAPKGGEADAVSE